MSLKTLPVLFVNMSGEMLYILSQRLRAQSVADDKASKVLGDIIGAVFNDKLSVELFKPQELYSRRAMRTLFDRLAHISIMRLNETSMDKLYDLMTMAVKYQLQSLTSPTDLLVVSLNHIDGIRRLLPKSDSHHDGIDKWVKAFLDTYMELNLIELHQLRQTLLNFFLDTRVKVSILLRDAKQLGDGHFIVPTSGCEISYKLNAPGKIQFYSGGATATVLKQFHPSASYIGGKVPPRLDAGLVEEGSRGTDLGLNMYAESGSAEVQGGPGTSGSTVAQTTVRAAKDYSVDQSGSCQQASSASDELSFLSTLVGLKPSAGSGDRGAKSDPGHAFRLNLFETDKEEKAFVAAAKEETDAAAAKAATYNVVKVARSGEQGKGFGSGMDKLISDINLEEGGNKNKTKGDDLLDLMDNA